MAKDVDAVMEQIPEKWRYRWCGGEDGLCFCVGCVQVGNRRVMAEALLGHPYRRDPEYIDESKIPEEVFQEYKVTREEWEEWVARNPGNAPTPQMIHSTPRLQRSRPEKD